MIGSRHRIGFHPPSNLEGLSLSITLSQHVGTDEIPLGLRQAVDFSEASMDRTRGRLALRAEVVKSPSRSGCACSGPHRTWLAIDLLGETGQRIEMALSSSSRCRGSQALHSFFACLLSPPGFNVIEPKPRIPHREQLLLGEIPYGLPMGSDNSSDNLSALIRRPPSSHTVASSRWP